MALSCGVNASPGDCEVERLEFGDRCATGASKGGGRRSGQSRVKTWVMRWGGGTVGPPKEMEEAGGEDDVAPAHPPPPVLTDAEHQAASHVPWLTCFSGHNPWAGPLLASGLKPLCSRLWPYAHPAGILSGVFCFFFFFFSFFFFLVFCLFRAMPSAYGGSQARDPIGAIAAGLCHSHSTTGSDLCLRPTPQLVATPDP